MTDRGARGDARRGRARRLEGALESWAEIQVPVDLEREMGYSRPWAEVATTWGVSAEVATQRRAAGRADAVRQRRQRAAWLAVLRREEPR